MPNAPAMPRRGSGCSISAAGFGMAGRSSLPPGVDELTRARSQTENGLGYGYLWWVIPPVIAGETRASAAGGFLALGYGGQAMGVIPGHRLIVVQLVDCRKDRSV